MILSVHDNLGMYSLLEVKNNSNENLVCQHDA